MGLKEWFVKSPEQKELNRQYREIEYLKNLLRNYDEHSRARLEKALNDLVFSIGEEQSRLHLKEGRTKFVYASKVIPMGRDENVNLPIHLQKAIDRKTSVVQSWMRRIRPMSDPASIVMFSKKMLAVLEDASTKYFQVIDELERSRPFAGVEEYKAKVVEPLKQIADPGAQLKAENVSTAEPVRAPAFKTAR